MSLQPGQQIGPYQVSSRIGAGGMGEVYRATDTRLQRAVALKVLPEAFLNDPDRLARFRREAQLLAALNHSHIAAIHGLEESDGIRALVMEFVDGETLADVIARGALPVDDAIAIARQIAEALEAAHDQGIVHRDLKPANIKVRPDGSVKVLDFGLAKLADRAAAADVGDVPGEVRDEVLNSPTMTTPGVTLAGVILGTAAYMSPEQAKGGSADRRSDIWSFGCVLFEMLTGRRAFSGNDVSEILASVLKEQPRLDTLPTATPASIRQLLRRCLEKNRARRLPHMATARIELDEVISGVAGHDVAPTPPRRSRWFIGVAALAALIAVAGAGFWAGSSRSRLEPSAPTSLRASIVLPSATPLTPGPYLSATLSPDGSTLAYIAASGAAARKLFVRRLDSFETTEIRDSEAAGSPFFSHDGRVLAFTSRGLLKKVALPDGVPTAITESSASSPGEWTADGQILFTRRPQEGLSRVSAFGGVPAVVTTPDAARNEASHGWPQLLPSGAVLFTVRFANRTDHQIRVLVNGTMRTIVDAGGQGRYVNGRLFYVVKGTLVWVPFNLETLTAGNDATEVVGDVLRSGRNPDVANLAMAANADIAYLPSSGFDARRALVQVWEKGATEVVTTDRQAIAPRLSPDGTRVVFSDGADIWSYTLKTDVWLQLTFDQLNDTPIWSPDGKTIVFRSRRDGGVMNIYRQSADGSGATERLTQSARVQWPAALTRDNRTLIVSEAASANNGDILTVALGGDGQSRSFIATPAATWAGGLSPDGRWLVYTSDESGRAEVYVTAFPSGSGRWRISNNGGTEPVWSRSGREVLYRERDRMMTVAIEEGSSFSYARPRLLFEGRYLHCCDGLAFYDAAGDGRGALMLRSEPAYEIRIVRGALARN